MTALFDDEEIERRYHLRIRREAEQENSENIARKMIADGMAYDKISDYTGLSVTEIEKIANEKLLFA